MKQGIVKKKPVISDSARPDAASSENPAVTEENKQNAVESKEMAQKNGMKRAVEEVNRKAKNSEIIFGIHDATNRMTIKVVDKSTKEVIREFPPEETLDMIAKVWELAGIMIDERG
ncbi:MAG: flagellar protein FlaG [Lachnospiraceae bacterium]|nr:flagellar protein FlaG [Lachnospiraceae bacterium]